MKELDLEKQLSRDNYTWKRHNQSSQVEWRAALES